jgi:hypothetical protein
MGDRKMYVYVEFQKGLYTVGFYDPDGRYHTDSDHGNRSDAADRVAYLNGSGPAKERQILK